MTGLERVDALVVALLAGFVCGFVVSVPVGPVNLSVINKALQRGFVRAFLLGLGAATAETVYALVLMAGHTTILDVPAVRKTLWIVSVLAIGAIGVRSLLFKEEKVEPRDVMVVERIRERWHHPRAFMLGFVLTISNLMLIVLWATMSSLLFAREWVTPEVSSRVTAAVGVFWGCAFWFFLLAFLVSRGHRRVKPRTLTLLVRTCGGVFLVFAGLLAYQMIAPRPLAEQPAWLRQSR